MIPRRETGVALSRPRPLALLAAEHGGHVDDDAVARVVAFVAHPWGETDESHLVPLLRLDALDAALRTEGVLLVDGALAHRVPEGRRWVHPHAAWVMAALLEDRSETPDDREHARIEAHAHVAASAKLGAFAVVKSGARIGAGSVIEPHAVIYGGVIIGARARIGAGAVIGRPGFGFATGPRGDVRRIPQRGGVRIEDDVEIGALCTVDAGTLGPTVIGRGAKLDAHVHVGHNALIREGAIVAAQSGFAGSVIIGKNALVGGQVGVADHVVVGDGARLAAKAGVIGDVPTGATYAGYPAVPRMRWLRGMARLFGTR